MEVSTALEGTMRFFWAGLAATILCTSGASASDAPTPVRARGDPPGAPRTAPAAPGSLEDAWTGTRWFMTPDEVLAALPAGAFRVTPEMKLPDGNVVAVGIEGTVFEGLPFSVRFVFEGGKLVLVSLRTPPDRYADAQAHDRVREALLVRWGAPLETTKDDALIDMRQTRWERGPSRTDLKYIPGVVAIVHYPRPAAPAAAAPASSGAATGSVPAAKP